MSKIRVRNRQNRYGVLFSLRCQVFRALADSADKWARDLRSDSRCGRQDAVAAGASPFSIPRGLPRGGSLAAFHTQFSIFYFLLTLQIPALAQVTERLPDLDETATSIVSI